MYKLFRSTIFNVTSIIVVSLLIFSCAGRTPIKKYDNRFLTEHGREVSKLKKKHKKIVEENESNFSSFKEEKYVARSVCGTDDIKAGKCYYDVENQKYYERTNSDRYPLSDSGQVVQNQLIKGDDSSNKYSVLLNKKKKMYYLSQNSGKFSENKIVDFDDIEIPRYRQSKAELGSKDYEYINNMDLQESIDYLTVINETRIQKRRELVMQQIKKEEEASLIQKAQGSVKQTQGVFSNLFKKFFGAKEE
jgi:hypothetical protein